MLSQIIFFAAVALLIILLLRRAAQAKQGLQAVGRFSRQVGMILAIGLNSVAALLRPLFKRGLVTPKNERRVYQAGPRPADIPTGQKFWEEGPLPDKLELSSHYEEGEKLYRAGKYAEAEQYFLKAAAKEPSDAKIYARLGLLYLQQKNYSDAIEALKVAVKLDKYNPSRHYNLALAYSGNKDVQRAIASAREAITLDPVTQKYRQLLEQLLNS